MKLYELNKNDRFNFSLVTGVSKDGEFLGVDGMYAKVKWDSEDYSTDHQFDFIACYVEVEETIADMRIKKRALIRQMLNNNGE